MRHIFAFLAISLNILNAATAQSLKHSNGVFSYKLYQKVLETNQKNFVISPFSALTDLTIAYFGARGQTATELQRALELTDNKESTASEFHALLTPLQTAASVLKVANKIFVNKNIEINDTYNAVVAQNFFTSVDRLDFNYPRNAAQSINGYVASKTNNLIKDLIDPSMLTPSTQVVLINAIYFKCAWDSPFNKRATRKEPFYTGAGASVQVDMMHLTSRNFKYADIKEFDAKLVGIAYKGKGYCLHILIPNEKEGLASLEESLTNVDLTLLSERLQLRYVALSMPKFKTKFKVSLNDPLKKLGIHEAFKSSADFGDMLVNPRNVAISDVVHQAYINVDEGGTEAAAATGIVLSIKSARIIRPQLPLEVRLNHPFIYYMVDSKHNNIFFVGRYMGK